MLFRSRDRLVYPDPGTKHFKAVHTASGKLASFGRWIFPHPTPKPQTEEEKAEKERRANQENGPAFPQGGNAAVFEDVFSSLGKAQEKWVVDEEMYVMAQLATHPDFQRRGCASMVLKHVLDMADKEGRKAYLEATRPGKPLYEKLGFKTVELMDFKSLTEEDEKAGRTTEEDKIGLHWVMIREPQPPKPEFHIAECTPGDIEEMIDSFETAFRQEPMHQYVFPEATCPRSKSDPWLRTKLENRLKNPDPAVKHFKTVHTESGNLASWARWSLPHPKEGAKTEDTKVDKEDDREEKKPDLPEGANVEAFQEYVGVLGECQKKWANEDMYVLELIATHPNFQKRGCASMLIRHVLDMADKEGKQAILAATRPGRPVYERLGWKTVEVVVFRTREVNESTAGLQDEDSLHWVMIREPHPLKPEFHIAECTLDDLKAMVDAYQSAFGREQVHQYMFPEATCPKEKSDPWLMAKFGKRLRAPAPGVKHFKTVHTASGKLASWGRWVFPHPAPNPQTEEEKAEEERRDKEENRPDLPEGANIEACEEFFGALDKSQKKWVVDEEMYVMGLLATHPDFQRRGCASMLLKYVLNMADKEGRKAYIEATKPGKPVYERLGWKTVEVLTFKSLDELDRKAGRTKEDDRVGIHWVMMRDPQPLRA